MVYVVFCATSDNGYKMSFLVACSSCAFSWHRIKKKIVIDSTG